MSKKLFSELTRLEQTNAVVRCLEAAIDSAREGEFTQISVVLNNNTKILTMGTPSSTEMIGAVLVSLFSAVKEHSGENRSGPSLDLLRALMG